MRNMGVQRGGFWRLYSTYLSAPDTWGVIFSPRKNHENFLSVPGKFLRATAKMRKLVGAKEFQGRLRKFSRTEKDSAPAIL